MGAREGVDRLRAWRLCAVLLLVVVALLTGCGDDDEGDIGDPTDESPPPAFDGEVTVSDFAERCVDVTESVEEAEIRFDDTPTMRLNVTSEFVLQIAVPGAGDSTLPGQGEGQGHVHYRRPHRAESAGRHGQPH